MCKGWGELGKGQRLTGLVLWSGWLVRVGRVYLWSTVYLAHGINELVGGWRTSLLLVWRFCMPRPQHRGEYHAINGWKMGKMKCLASETRWEGQMQGKGEVPVVGHCARTLVAPLHYKHFSIDYR